MSLTTPDKIRSLQRKLYCLTKTVPCQVSSPDTSNERQRRVPRGESQPESRMPEIGTSGLMSGDGKRGDGQVAPKLPRPSSTLP